MTFLRRLLVGFALFATAYPLSAETPEESFDRIIPALMAKWNVPGGSVAVVRDGRLVFAKGYGRADRVTGQPVQASSLFRIASVSKPITSVAILKLAEEGRLDLDAKAFALLGFQSPAGTSVDPRLQNITVRHLLTHSAGWNRDVAGDPMFQSVMIAQAMGTASPPTADTIIRYMMGQPLQFTPGTAYAYSNFGYAVLGRIIEKVTGQTYETYVREHILRPMGISCMQIGRSLAEGRAAGEVKYYDHSAAPQTPSLFGGNRTSWPYGGFYQESLDAHGGWIASAVDLLRFMTAIDGRATPRDFLSAASIAQMTSRPSISSWSSSPYYYSMGWLVRPSGSDANWWHDGSLPGTASLLVRTYHGYAWAALFNSRPSEFASFHSEIDSSMWTAVNAVTQWPAADLFANFPACSETCGATSLCLSAKAFEVSLTASDPRTGNRGSGIPIARNDLFGYFSLPGLTGNPSNPEIFVKLLDGRPVNDKYWVFYGGLTDLEVNLTVTQRGTGNQKTYGKDGGSFCGGADTSAFAIPLRPSASVSASEVRPTAACSSTALCLGGGQFEVTLTATDPRSDGQGSGQPIPESDLFGYFSLPSLTGNAENPEVFVKLLDGRPVNGKYWFFYGGLTDLQLTLTVRETSTGRTKTYTKDPYGFCGGADTAAF